MWMLVVRRRQGLPLLVLEGERMLRPVEVHEQRWRLQKRGQVAAVGKWEQCVSQERGVSSRGLEGGEVPKSRGGAPQQVQA